VGQIVHGALERWRFPGRDPRFAAWAGSEALACGITDAAELRDAVRRAERLLTRFQATALFGQMDASPQCLHEVPYSWRPADGSEDEGIASGVLDALFQTPDGWTLVEFKTDYVGREEDLEVLLEGKDYRLQMARYLAAAEYLLGVRPRPALCFLNHRGTVRVVDDRW
jgi:ATP-dependent exoDNAse (exonuclease V) beta subunit